MFLKRLKESLPSHGHGKPPKKQPKISLLIPFTSNSTQRKEAFKWLLEYWHHELPDAEIVVGKNHNRPFCKTAALNEAAAKATGKVLVMVDSDAYISGQIIERCADRILEEISEGERLWYVPYRHLYRLNKKATNLVLQSDPRNSFRFTSPPAPEYFDNDGIKSGYGHRYGAMIMIFPREALSILGCFDERFKGWGGEDIALLRTLDTLYGKHKTTNNDILHLWHPIIGKNYTSRIWLNQKQQFNSHLTNRYHLASRNPSKMRALVDEGCEVYHKRKKKEKKVLDKLKR